MVDSDGQLEDLSTTADAGRSLPSMGPDWDAAIEHGIDVTLLLGNAKLFPAQRLQRMDALNRLAAELQERTVPERVRIAISKRRLEEKLRALGLER